MSRKHATVVALALALAVVMGFVALARTARAGSSAHAAGTVSSASITRRSHALDRLEASLRRSLQKQPPALPAVPAFRKQAQPAASRPARSAVPATPVAPRVVYVRPAPIVVHRHAGGEREREHETGERQGQGLDD
jgi:hypothetical protein